ncbi:MAG: amidohydrolase, partial [Phenylobacterium sp.]|nr:amidohydrolase [Phenylobacterium sp.]
MPYVEGQTIHDADSHVMELPGAILPYVEARHREDFAAKTLKKNALVEWTAKAEALHDDPEFR